MPRDPAQNAALRDRVRADLRLPFADPLLPLADFEDDTSEEALASLRAAGLVPARREAAEGQARQDAEQARRNLRGFEGQRVPVGFGNLITLVGSALESAIAGPIPFDFTIRQVFINLSSTAAAGTIFSPFWNFLVAPERAISIAALRSATPLITTSGLSTEGFEFARMNINGQESSIAIYDVFSQPFPSGSFIHFLGDTAGARVEPVVMVEEFTVTPFAARAAFLPPIGRISINLNTAPTRKRGTSPPVPRGARISVTQGGRVLSERIVSWPALQPAIKALYLEQQLGQPADPNIQWIM